MYVLHGAWLAPDGPREGRLAVWAESADLYQALPSRQRRPGRAHPFAARTDRLTVAIDALGVDPSRDAEYRVIPITLPTNEGGPAGSPFVRDPEDDRGAAATAPAPWRVEALLLDAARAIDVLPLLAGGHAGAGLIPADDLVFWSHAAAFVLDLLARERFLPMIERDRRRYVARWRALLDDWDDAVRLASLARAMPPVAGVATWKSGTPAPEPRDLLNGFVRIGVDAVARKAMGTLRVAKAAYAWSATETWLESLGAERQGQAFGYWNLGSMYPQISTWAAPVLGDGGQTAPFRLCLRLEAPEPVEGAPVAGAAAGPWKLSYLLQATDDPSLLVTAAEVWQRPRAISGLLRGRLDEAQDLLLQGLGRAARLLPPVEASLSSPAPNSCTLTAVEAYEFIREKALTLRASGIGVLVPGFITRLGLRLKVGRNGDRVERSDSPGMFGMDTLVQFDWQVALGGEAISREEFEALARLKEPLVQVRGRWVELNPQMVEQAMTFLQKQGKGDSVPLASALRMALAPEGEDGLPIEGVDTEGWFDDLLQRLGDGADRERLEEPDGFVGRLRPYQKSGVSWLATLRRYGLGACLADDMGLGKCLAADTTVVVNGIARTMEEVWETFAAGERPDGEGVWASTTEPLMIDALDEITGRMALRPIRRLYRQRVSERMRMVTLEDGNKVTITRRHKLLTDRGWTNDLRVGDNVCVTAQSPRLEPVGAASRLTRLTQARSAQTLQTLSNREVLQCQIENIVDIKYDGCVYDFEVEGDHNFVAENILCHNTIEVAAMLLHTRQGDEPRPPALVVCPTSVVGNWRHELNRFAPELKVLVHHGAGRTKDDLESEAAKHDVVISSYPLLHRDAEHLLKVGWSDVILDEAQNVKNPSTKAAQTARRLRSAWRAALTGTPVENRLSDLWSIFAFINPGYLGSQEDFRRRFTSPIERQRDQEATAQLKSLVSPFILRRLKTDRKVIDDLPEKNEMKVFCTLTKEQATLYQAVVQDAMRQIAEAEGLERRGRILAALTKLKQVCNHPVLLLKDGGRLPGRSGKLARLTEMLEEAVAVDDRALVFTQFAEMGTLLVQHLTKELGEEVLFLYGGTPAAERDKMVRRFQQDAGGPRVFVLSIRAGGTGLNLTRANHVFHFDRWWNPAVENQATDRAFRIGQRRDVQVHKYVCAGTLEETIDALIERKVELSEAIVGANESWITEMSTDQLRDLFLLRRDALEE